VAARTEQGGRMIWGRGRKKEKELKNIKTVTGKEKI
jgi:hypothetical protein